MNSRFRVASSHRICLGCKKKIPTNPYGDRIEVHFVTRNIGTDVHDYCSHECILRYDKKTERMARKLEEQVERLVRKREKRSR